MPKPNGDVPKNPYNGKCETCGGNLKFVRRTHGYTVGSAKPVNDINIYDCDPCDTQWFYIYDIEIVDAGADSRNRT